MKRSAKKMHGYLVRSGGTSLGPLRQMVLDTSHFRVLYLEVGRRGRQLIPYAELNSVHHESHELEVRSDADTLPPPVDGHLAGTAELMDYAVVSGERLIGYVDDLVIEEGMGAIIHVIVAHRNRDASVVDTDHIRSVDTRRHMLYVT